MALLDNITVVLSDLELYKRDITSFYYSGQTDFTNELANAKKDLYRMLKDYERILNPNLTDTALALKLEDVKDHSDTTNLKDILCLITISLIMESSRLIEESKYYRARANKIPLDYYIDSNTDSAVSSDEERVNSEIVRFSR